MSAGTVALRQTGATVTKLSNHQTAISFSPAQQQNNQNAINVYRGGLGNFDGAQAQNFVTKTFGDDNISALSLIRNKKRDISHRWGTVQTGDVNMPVAGWHIKKLEWDDQLNSKWVDFSDRALNCRGVLGRTGPKKTGVFKAKRDKRLFERSHPFEAPEIALTTLRRFRDRSDLPCSTKSSGSGLKLEWKVEPEKLDFQFYLPIFVEGILDPDHIVGFTAWQGVQDLVNSKKNGDKANSEMICKTIKCLIMPLKKCLNTHHDATVCKALKVIEMLIDVDPEIVGPYLVQYYRQLLPICNLFHSKTRNLGDGIDYAQRMNTDMGFSIHQFLEKCERTGGHHAFVNIKYIIPTYESCMTA